MDIPQLLLTAGATLGVVLVGLMAVVPSVMEVGCAQGHLTVPPPTASVRRGGHRRHHHTAPLAL